MKKNFEYNMRYTNSEKSKGTRNLQHVAKQCFYYVFVCEKYRFHARYNI